MIRPYSLLLVGLAFLSLPGRAESKPNWQAEWDREIRSYWDFLQPKWKGKILSRDPRISGSQRIGLRMYYHTPELGAEFIRRLYAARRRRQIYTGGQAGVYGHGADPRHRRESVGAGEDEVKTSWSPAQQPRGHTNTPLHQTLSLVA